MPEPDFDGLRQHLLRGGVAPRHARRTIVELQDHFLDLKEDLTTKGFTPADAAAEASRQLGPLDAIAGLVTARPELRRWFYRYPRLGRVLLPIAYALLLPGTSLIAGASYAPVIVRWSAIVSLSAVITAGMFLAIQLSITLG